MAYRPFFVLAFSFILLSGCDCHFETSGLVLDARSGEPIAEVVISQTDSVPRYPMDLSGHTGEFSYTAVARDCGKIQRFFLHPAYEALEITLHHEQRDTIYLQPKDIATAAFHQDQPFQLTEIRQSADYPSSADDPTICEQWRISKREIEKLLAEVEPGTPFDIHHAFDHLHCMIQGKLTQGGKTFTFMINAGGFLSVSNRDTTFHFANYNKALNPYFLSEPWTEEER